MGVAFGCMGLLGFLESATYISIIATVIRLLQGASSGCINTTLY